jgi:hypothetical protein
MYGDEWKEARLRDLRKIIAAQEGAIKEREEDEKRREEREKVDKAKNNGLVWFY